jgi:hypothetical protein
VCANGACRTGRVCPRRAAVNGGDLRIHKLVRGLVHLEAGLPGDPRTKRIGPPRGCPAGHDCPLVRQLYLNPRRRKRRIAAGLHCGRSGSPRRPARRLLWRLGSLACLTGPVPGRRRPVEVEGLPRQQSCDPTSLQRPPLLALPGSPQVSSPPCESGGARREVALRALAMRDQRPRRIGGARPLGTIASRHKR